MKRQTADPEHLRFKRSLSLGRYSGGPLGAYLDGAPVHEVGGAQPSGAGAEAGSPAHAVVLADYVLQDVSDYRRAIQGWFASVAIGGRLVIVVPHAFLYERQNVLPSRWNAGQRRLYTPASLMQEVEEALEPNSYRVRHLGDVDAGYDYAADPETHPAGAHEVAVVLERITPPAWGLSEREPPERAEPDYAFEPLRTRVEVRARAPSQRILLLKLDHLGDFIMGVPALEKARAAFPDAEITLVVGSWNETMARELALFDHVLTFDGFPRNASEETDDVRGKVSEFEQRVRGEYDLAIDLRNDHDTRILLQSARARIRAGVGSKSEFEFLDIFLPIDGTRSAERAWEMPLSAADFSAQDYCDRTRYRVICPNAVVDGGAGAVVWGPYRRLAAGQFLFEPYLDIDPSRAGVVRYDIALDAERLFERTLSQSHRAIAPIAFTNLRPEASFEFRLWCVDGEPLPQMSFYGGRLLRRGGVSVLHQSEYLSLLVELVAMRVSREGVLQAWSEAG